MHGPRLTGRQWFWALMLAGFVWAYAGGRWATGSAGAVMCGGQDIVSNPARFVLTPASWLATQGQLAIDWVFRSIGESHRATETLASLEEKNRRLEDELAVQTGQMQILSEDLKRHNVIQQIGLSPRDVVRAYITGHNAGAGADTIRIDKGAQDRVHVDDPVISDEIQIVGRVMSVGQKTAEVRLISFPKAKVGATIVRLSNGKAMPLLKEPCLVQGMGNGEFKTDTVKLIDAKIAPGDIVQLFDHDWPVKLQYFILGVVSEVGVNPEQPLRYELRSRASINGSQPVEVLVNW